MCALAYSAHLRSDMDNEAIFHQLLNKCLALVQRSLTNQTPTEYCPKRNAKKQCDYVMLRILKTFQDHLPS